MILIEKIYRKLISSHQKQQYSSDCLFPPFVRFMSLPIPCPCSITLPRWLRRRLVQVVSVGAAVSLLTFIVAQFICDSNTSDPAHLFHSRASDNHITYPYPHTYLAVLILSAPGDSQRRNVIRDTWLRLSAKGTDTVRHWFPIGLKGLGPEQIELLRTEQAVYQDLMLLDNYQERFDSLAAKMRSTFVQLSKLIKFDFVLKVDADSFVRLGVLLKALKDQAHPMLYWGFLDGRSHVKRQGKYRERHWVLCDRYLPYAVGGGYVLAWPLVDFIDRNAALLQLYANEDVSVGAWLAGLNVRYVHDPRFDTEYVSRGCSNEYLITHKQNELDMQHKFESLKMGAPLCGGAGRGEYRARGSYVYDWSVPPSMCCSRSNDSKVP